mgnify:CR=1 FL=1
MVIRKRPYTSRHTSQLGPERRGWGDTVFRDHDERRWREQQDERAAYWRSRLAFEAELDRAEASGAGRAALTKDTQP